MSRFAALLRALLCLVLLLNGTVYAHAATRMAMGDVALAAQAGPDHEPPCHDGMEMARPVGVDISNHHDDGAGLQDCCKADSCDNFCAQHAPALAWPVSLGALPFPQAEALAYRAGVHASARLAHRHRPPILAA